MNENTILIFGDICSDNDYRKLFDKTPCNVFSEEIQKDIRNALISVANLECPSTGNKVQIEKCGPSLRAYPQDILQLKNMGFNVLSLANNHILDYGEQGIRDTLKNCEAAGINFLGAGENQRRAKEPFVFEIGSKRIGILSFAEAEFNLAGKNSYGANGFDVYESFDDITELKNKCDYVIVLYHGGIEYYKYPSPLLQKKCRKMAKSGADLILCQHSHCIGTMEIYDSSTIIYGQGNSVFGYREGNNSWNEGLVVKVNIKSSIEIDLRLMRSEKDGVRYATKDEQNLRMKEFMEESEHLQDLEWLENSWKRYALQQESLDLPMVYGHGRVFNKLNRLLNNHLIKMLYSKKKQSITMNLIRCESHHEVVRTIFEHNVFENK